MNPNENAQNPVSTNSDTVGGREFGEVHDPTQAQQASGNAGLANNAGQHEEDASKPLSQQPVPRRGTENPSVSLSENDRKTA